MDIELTETFENVEDEEELELTPAQVIELMEEAWINEKFAPEILPNKSEIVDCLLGQLTYMEDNLKGLENTDFRKSIHQLEVDRLRYLLTSYLRTRLEKIETYVFCILKEESERSEKGEDLYLTENELKYAQNYKQSLEHHFENVFSFYPGLPADDWREKLVVPNTHSFVFAKSKAEIGDVVIDDGGDEGDLVDLTKGSQMLISYHSIANLVKRGDIKLI